MKGKTLAIMAAAFCAGMFVAFVPGDAPGLANGLVEDSGAVAPHIDAADRLAAMWAPLATAGKKIVQERRLSNERDRRTAPNQDWPYCDPACLKANGHDRPTEESVVEKNRSLSPSTETSPAPTRRVPLGCDPSFSPVADPARAHIYRRCIA